MLSDAPFEGINFGDLPESVNELLQDGVFAYRSDRAHADRLFRLALACDPAALPTYLCLYKIHTYQGNLGEARAMAEAGLAEAARQAGWPAHWDDWPQLAEVPDGPGRLPSIRSRHLLSLPCVMIAQTMRRTCWPLCIALIPRAQSAGRSFPLWRWASLHEVDDRTPLRRGPRRGMA